VTPPSTPREVWLLVREWDDYRAEPEVVGVYATEALARGAAEAECVEVLTPWQQWMPDPPAWELRGTRARAYPWDHVHRAQPYVWRLTRHRLIEEVEG
jgi:hypothetical protein